MRNYLTPAMKYASRALPQPSDLRVFMIKRRTLALSMAASFLVVTTIGMMAVHAVANGQDQSTFKHEQHVEGNTLSTSITTETPQATSGVNNVTEKSTEVKANVTVNGEAVPVPNNGNYSKTFTTDNGTTHVNVSSNANGAGSGFNHSMSSTHTSVSSNAFTNDVHIHTSP